MNKKVLIGIIIAAVVILLATLAFMTARPPATDNTTDTAIDTRIDSPSEGGEIVDSEVAVEPTSVATIAYTDDGFSPSTTTVKKGSTITVTNNSSVSVRLSSADHPTHEKQPALNMDTLKPGESGTITITKAGTWGYHDHINASMTGTIIVTE